MFLICSQYSDQNHKPWKNPLSTYQLINLLSIFLVSLPKKTHETKLDGSIYFPFKITLQSLYQVHAKKIQRQHVYNLLPHFSLSFSLVVWHQTFYFIFCVAPSSPVHKPRQSKQGRWIGNWSWGLQINLLYEKRTLNLFIENTPSHHQSKSFLEFILCILISLGPYTHFLHER